MQEQLKTLLLLMIFVYLALLISKVKTHCKVWNFCEC